MSEASRKIRYYAKQRYGFRSKYQKMGVPRRNSQERKLLCVHGTGRCGTTYLSRLFRTIGMDVGHEFVGEHGTVSHFFFLDSAWHPMLPWHKKKAHVGERRSDYVFDHEFMLVRHPLPCIRSIWRIFGGWDWEFLEDNGVIKEGVEPRLLRCMAAYYHMNRRMERIATERFRIEAFDPDGWHRMCDLLDLEDDARSAKVPVTNKAHGPAAMRDIDVTWDVMKDTDKHLTGLIRRMTERYGYEEDTP